MSRPDRPEPEGPDVERLEALLERALELSADARAALVAQARADDSALGAELASLVAHAEPAQRFFGALTAATRDATLDLELPTDARPPVSGPDDRFRIEGEIGHGGMGVVYRAWDRQLERRVALKFLPHRWRADREAETRFLAEARAAAGLDHPNVCTLLEIGAWSDGRPFLAMPCYEGETLQARMARGRLPTAEVVRIGAGIARGLAAAHRAGLVHGDVKPGNVMLNTDGGVKLLDFGIARAADRATRGGLRAGTEAYMAPERRRGAHVDARADLWALGVVLHEMLAGERPRDGGGSGGGWPPGSGRLRRLTDRLLAADPDARPDTADEVAATLESLARPPARAPFLAAAAVVLVALGGWGVAQLRPAQPIERVAVLPFEDRTGEPALAYAAGGLHGELVEALGRVPMLTVVTVSDSAALEGPVGELAKQLGVGALVRGAAVVDADGPRVDLELVSASGGSVLRASYRGHSANVLPHLGDAALAIARASLGTDDLGLAPGASRAYEPPPDAHEDYLRGIEALTASSLEVARTSSDRPGVVDSAVVHFERAARSAPDWADAWARLAGALHWRAGSPDDFRRARAAAERALAIDADHAQALASRGYVRLVHDDDWEGAGRDVERSIALGGRAHWIYALYFGGVGRHDESLVAARRAQEEDPLSLELRRQVASALSCTGRDLEAYHATRELWQEVSGGATREDSLYFLPLLALRAHHAGRNDEALAWVSAPAHAEDAPFAEAVYAMIQISRGHADEVEPILERARARDPGLLPTLLVALGDTAEAMAIMERRAADSPRRSRFFTCSEIYRALRGYPPMEALAARVTAPRD